MLLSTVFLNKHCQPTNGFDSLAHVLVMPKTKQPGRALVRKNKQKCQEPRVKETHNNIF